jgi:hypothetical protein
VTAVSSPLFRSLTSTTLCGFRDFRNDAASIAKSFRIAISARRAVYSYFVLCALCSRHVTKWRRVLPPAGVALIADPPTYLRVGCVVHAVSPLAVVPSALADVVCVTGQGPTSYVQ